MCSSDLAVAGLDSATRDSGLDQGPTVRTGINQFNDSGNIFGSRPSAPTGEVEQRPLGPGPMDLGGNPKASSVSNSIFGGNGNCNPQIGPSWAADSDTQMRTYMGLPPKGREELRDQDEW